MLKNNLLLVLLYISVVFNLVSCTNKDSSNGKTTQNLLSSDSVLIDSLDYVEPPLYSEIPNPNILTADYTRFYYMISGLFDDRDSIQREFPLVQKRKWKALTYLVDKRKFYLKPVELDTVYWHDDCNGVDMLTLESISETKTTKDTEKPNEIEYIYLTGLDTPLGEIPSFFHTQRTVVPGHPYTFEYGNKKYTLRAEGKLTDNNTMYGSSSYEKDDMGRIANDGDSYCMYNLYLESDGISQLLNSACYEYMSLLIYFVGDLDGDGKPDFLFQTNTWYEGSEVTLFLSSKATEGELVKNMGASGNYYSC